MANDVVTIPDGYISDYIDGKFRKDTPEEYVRQTIEKRLVNEHEYKRGQVRVEFTLHVGSKKPRVDLAIFENESVPQTQENVRIAIECKKESVSPSAKKDGVGQLKSYMSCCPNCEWGLWTNSLQKFVFRKSVDDEGHITFMEYNDIPSANGTLDDVNRPKRKTLKSGVQHLIGLCKMHPDDIVDAFFVEERRAGNSADANLIRHLFAEIHVGLALFQFAVKAQSLIYRTVHHLNGSLILIHAHQLPHFSVLDSLF